MKLTIKRAKELALQNYSKGGDGLYECYEDWQIENLINSGIDTESKLLDWFKQQYEIDEEYRKAADWMAYGTTDEEELRKIHEAESKSVTEVEEAEMDYEEDYDPCFGCMRRDNSYNCKHCKYGDDGCYESPFDVYTPAELGISVKW
jgi:hypothetical protein